MSLLQIAAGVHYPSMMEIHEDHPDLTRLAGEGRVVAYVGYGSLVNRNTLRTKFLGIRRARVRGWRRFWLPREAPPIALLSVKPEQDSVLDGVVVYDHIDHLLDVDEREAGYLRREVDPSRVEVEAPPVPAAPLFIYEADRGTPTAEDAGCFIQQSYLDAVLQGFLSIYGQEGLQRFVWDTDGFEAMILADRAEPGYPRSVELREGEAALFDRLVVARGARLIAADA